MSEENAPDTPAPEQEKKVEDKDAAKLERTVLRPYPKVVFFYLTWIAALVCGIVTASFSGADDPTVLAGVQRWWTMLFLIVFAFNLLVVAFEFGRMLSVAILLGGTALVLLLFLLGVVEDVFKFLGNLNPRADHNFFFTVFFIFTVIYLLVFLQTRFNYWVVRQNELLHKHGFLGDVKRYHAQGVKIDKEIPDVLEFVLLRSGSMILHVEHETRAVVLDNIIGINRKEQEVKALLESYAVRIDKT